MDFLLFDQLYASLGKLRLDEQKRLTWQLNEYGDILIDSHQPKLVKYLHSLADPLNALTQWTNERGFLFLPCAAEVRQDWERVEQLELHPEERFVLFRALSSHPEKLAVWRKALAKVEA